MILSVWFSTLNLNPICVKQSILCLLHTILCIITNHRNLSWGKHNRDLKCCIGLLNSLRYSLSQFKINILLRGFFFVWKFSTLGLKLILGDLVRCKVQAKQNGLSYLVFMHRWSVARGIVMTQECTKASEGSNNNIFGSASSLPSSLKNLKTQLQKDLSDLP